LTESSVIGKNGKIGLSRLTSMLWVRPLPEAMLILSKKCGKSSDTSSWSLGRLCSLLFLTLRYEEMPTNKWVESSFWNFDSLFQPQQHPARDMHDTFFLEHPRSTLTLPEDYVARVKEMHESGGHGSIGW
jgi:hypothetical protein